MIQARMSNRNALPRKKGTAFEKTDDDPRNKEKWGVNKVE